MTQARPDKIAAPTVITTHANADFDALAAMVAASRLYPDAVLVFPGSQERTLRHFFIESAMYMFGFKQARDIDPATVTMLVMVDTRQRSRVPHVEAVLDNPGLVVHQWDHHPDTADDVPAHVRHVEEIGSTTALIVRELRARETQLTPDEATILGLGIFEDTGSFTFASTTRADFEAAGWLLSQGMELNTIAELTVRELTSEQVMTLNTLLESAATHDFKGIPIVFAEASLENYMGDFAVLAHKMMDMENAKVLFALARMADRVQVVARSRIKEVDVGHICTVLGGGGHPYAASASVRDRTLQQVRDQVFNLLYATIHAEVRVRSLMSAPVVAVEDNRTIREAEEIMGRYGLKAIPVFAKGTRHCVGHLEHQTALRAITHGIGHLAVTEYMQRSTLTVPLEANLQDVMDIIVTQRQRLVPVVDNDEVIGVVTRTDLINTIVEEPARIPESLHEGRKARNIRGVLKDKLPPLLYRQLERAGQLGDRLGVPVYAVGGFVRDIMLERPNYDLDLVVEGDGIEFARALAAEVQGRMRAHHKFRTAVVIYTDDAGQEQRIDVATARLEYYEYPAALPTVELSSIKMDLFRRDFTINALAVQVNAAHFGQLVDFFGSQRDIKEKAVRVLHSLSFVEDPTRILRAIRFEQRYAFRIGAQCERLIKNALALDLIAKLSGTRLFHELRHIFDEEAPVACLERMEQFDLLGAIHPLLKLNPAKIELLERIDEVLGWYRLLYIAPMPERWIVYLLGLGMNAKYQDMSLALDRLALPRKQRMDFMNLRERVRASLPWVERWARDGGLASELHAMLRPMELEGLLYLMARTKAEDVRKHLSHYLTRIRDEKLDITGEDLKAMGLEPGPAFSRVFRRVLAAKIDGCAPTRKEQLELAHSFHAEETVTPEPPRKRKPAPPCPPAE